jgi:hypothetical protein
MSLASPLPPKQKLLFGRNVQIHWKGMKYYAICHGSSCKRRTGSAFGWSAYFPDDKVVAKTGTFSVYAKDGAAGYNRFFCARCGTTLYWKSFGFLPDQTGIAGGCFVDDPLPRRTFQRRTRIVASGSNCRRIGLGREGAFDQRVQAYVLQKQLRNPKLDAVNNDGPIRRHILNDVDDSEMRLTVVVWT